MGILLFVKKGKEERKGRREEGERVGRRKKGKKKGRSILVIINLQANWIFFNFLIIRSSYFHFYFNHFSYLHLKQKQSQFYYLS